MARIKVLVVDDQALFAAGIEIILKGLGKDDFSVVGIANGGRQAVEMAARLRPDVVLMDVRMPDMNGVEATRLIHERFPDMKIMILTTFDDDQYVIQCLNHGALGYILKNVAPADLMMSIKAVHSGHFFVSPSVGYKLVKQAEASTHVAEESQEQYRGRLNYLLACFDTLTTREAEILHLLVLDHDNREIATELSIAEQTVKNHISVIYQKLGVADRVHAQRLVKRSMSQGGSRQP